jgi:short-subunit dehydrogenase
LERFEGKVAAVTGAASGIGRALAEELARGGAHLALADVDEAGLGETANRCSGAGIKVATRRLDVADRRAVFAWAQEVLDEHGRVHLVVNNAGVALAANVATMSLDDLEWLMGIDFWGVVHGTMAFLPHLRAAGEGHIVNISSVFGLLSVPSQSAYNAAKFAVRGFTEALRMELEIERSGVSCTTVLPGGIRTNIVRNARVDPEVIAMAGGAEKFVRRFDRLARTTPESAARQILGAVVKNRRRVLVGADAKALDLVSRLPAALHQRVMVAGGVAGSRRARRQARRLARRGG